MKTKRSIADLWQMPCSHCGRAASDHIWRCSGCGDPLPTDSEGYPIFDDHDTLFADLSCPPSPDQLN
jgi:hypothetical protein